LANDNFGSMEARYDRQNRTVVNRVLTRLPIRPYADLALESINADLKFLQKKFK